jgi:calpain-15
MILHEEVTDKEGLWKQIWEADQKKFVMATSVSSDRQHQSSAVVKNMGLVDAHAYSLISAHIVKSGLSSIKLIKIRNPWGRKEWNGDWSDQSSKWTPDLKA